MKMVFLMNNSVFSSKKNLCHSTGNNGPPS